MSETSEKLRAVALSFVMITSVFVATVAFSGVAAAANDSVSIHETVGGTEITGGDVSDGQVVAVRVSDGTTSDGTSSRTQVSNANGDSFAIAVYDDGTGPDPTAGDGVYWGSFTVVAGSSNTDSTTSTIGVDEGNTASLYADLDGGRDGSSASVTADYTSPAISNVNLDESSGDMVVSFDSDEQLGGSAGDVAVTVTGPNSATYSFDRTQFAESGSGPYTYALSVTRAYDDGDGTYAVSVDDAKDSAGNNGGMNGDGSGLTASYSYSSGSDTTAPTISNVNLGESSGNMVISFDSDEQLGGSAGDVAVTVTGPNSATYSFDRTQFSESGVGPYTYTIAVAQAYDDGDGTYSMSVDDAKDSAGNNGGNNGDGSGLTASYSYSSGSDTTAPTISNVNLGESSGDMTITFESDEQLGGSASDLAVTVGGPNGATYSFDRTQFSESGSGPYYYALSATQAYDDGDGTYSVSVDDAKDAAGNNGGMNGDGSGLTDSYSYSSGGGGGDTTAPTISNVVLDGSSGNMVITFDSDEQLGTSASDLAVTVSGPNGATYSFDRTQFSESGSGSFTYTIGVQQAYDDGDGTYAVSVDDAKDAAGNNGGMNGDGSGLLDDYTYSSGGGGGDSNVVSKDIEYISGPAKFQNDADVEKNIDFDVETTSRSLAVNLYVKQSELSPGEEKRDLTHSAVGFTESTEIKLEITFKNLDPDILMGPANVNSWSITDPDTTDNKRDITITLNPTVAQRNFEASLNPSAWDGASYDSSWDQAQVGVDALVGFEAYQFPDSHQLASWLDGARLNTDAQAFTVPKQGPNGALQFDVAAPHCKVGAVHDGDAQCASQYVNNDGFYEAVIPSGYVSNVWGDVDASKLTVVSKDDGQSTLLQSVTITERPSGAIYIEATDIHYSNPTLEVQADTTDPTADAGSDRTVDEDTSVSFDGTGSSDGETSITSYEWDFDDDGTYETTGATPSHTFSSPGSKTVTLRVTDGAGNTATDTVTITVSDVTAPTADAGSDQIVTVGTTATFDGSASTDNVGVTTYEWDIGADNSVDATGANPSYTFASTGTYTVELTAKDAAGNTDTDTLTVTVNDATAPTADAGSDATVVAGNQLSFDGSASSDNVGVTTYEWDVGADGSVEATGATPTHTFASAGTYTVELTAKDAAGNTDTDTLTVTVEPADEAQPTADAGSDVTVTVGESVTLDGSASSDDIGVTGYQWDVDEDGLAEASDASVTHTYRSPGTYEVELRVFDDAGKSDADSVTVTVSDATAPTADAGADANAAVGEPVGFDGTASTDNVGVATYEWDVGADGSVEATGATPTHTFDAPGTYTVELTVADAGGNTDTDTLTVTVSDTSPPTAEAGENLTVAAGAQVAVDASNSTDDAGIDSYVWDVGADGIGDATGATATYTFAEPGTYTVELGVTDAGGNTDTDALTVTVEDVTAPTAEAGDNLTATAGEPVLLAGTNSTDDVGIDSYAWDVDADNETEMTGAAANHTFPSNGTYTVELTVTDAAGNADTDTLVVNVTDDSGSDDSQGDDENETEEDETRHESGTSKQVYDSAAGEDNELDRTDLLRAVQQYVRTGSLEGVPLGREDVLALVQYYLQQS